MDKSVQGVYIGIITMFICVVWKLIAERLKLVNDFNYIEYNVVFVSGFLTMLIYLVI